MGPVFSSCGDEPPQSNQKPDMYEGFDDDQLKLIKAQKTTSANAPGVVQVTSGPDESQEPAPGTMEFMPVKTFTSSKPVRDPKTGGITSAFSKDFRSGKVLGTGGFAVVKQCTHIKSGKPYAVKVESFYCPTVHGLWTNFTKWQSWLPAMWLPVPLTMK